MTYGSRLLINGQVLESSDHVEFLGVKFDSLIAVEGHVQSSGVQQEGKYLLQGDDCIF